MYHTPPATFDELVAPYPEHVRDVAIWLRDLILTSFPQLNEQIHGGTKVANALYSVGSPDRVALGIQPGPRFVKLFIHDPDHLPASDFKLEGSGRHMRHIKFDEVPADRRESLVALAGVPVKRRSGER